MEAFSFVARRFVIVVLRNFYGFSFNVVCLFEVLSNSNGKMCPTQPRIPSYSILTFDELDMFHVW